MLPGGLVDLGGDLALWGETPERGPWRIAVADPRRPGTNAGVLLLRSGGVATSGRDVRRFGPGGSLHHLIDPATGEPAQPGPLAVTVVAPSAAEAEAHATALAISPRPTPPRRTSPGSRGSPRSTSRTTASRSRSGAPPLAQTRIVVRSGRMTTSLPLAWLIARASGLIAFGLLTLSVWLGLAMSTRLLGPKRAKSLLGLHRTLAWTGLAMVGLHVGALLLDPTLHFTALSALVPFAAPWKPGAVALGVVAGWLSSRARRLLPDAEVDRPEGLAAAALRELRGVRARARTRAARRHRPEGARRPGARRCSRRGPCSGSPSTGCSCRGPLRAPRCRRLRRRKGRDLVETRSRDIARRASLSSDVRCALYVWRALAPSTMTTTRRQTVFAGLDRPQAWPGTRGRPQPQRLEAALDTLPGVGPTLKRRLAKLGLETVRDLLEHRPRRYEAAVPEVAIAALARRRRGGDRRRGAERQRAPPRPADDRDRTHLGRHGGDRRDLVQPAVARRPAQARRARAAARQAGPLRLRRQVLRPRRGRRDRRLRAGLPGG